MAGRRSRIRKPECRLQRDPKWSGRYGRGGSDHGREDRCVDTLAVVPAVQHVPEREASMIWLAVLLVVAWLLGWGVFNVAGGLIHLLLVVAVVVFLFNFISGRRAV